MRKRISKAIRFYRRALEASVVKFLQEDALTLSAALAFYAIFSLPSILLIIFWTSAHFYKEVAVRDAIFSEIGKLVGQEGSQQLMATVEGLDIQEPTWWATIVGIGVLMFTATTVLVTMQSVLNRLFEVKSTDPKGQGIWGIVRDRLISFTLLLVITFILLVSLVVDTLITAFGSFVAKWLGALSNYVMVFDSFLLNLGATTVLFALFFRYLPDVRLKWKDIWFGALVTAVLFIAGKDLIGFFIGSSTAADLYEAAGSLMVMMLWLYYAWAIFLFGAAFTFARNKLKHDEVTGNCNDSECDRSDFTDKDE